MTGFEPSSGRQAAAFRDAAGLFAVLSPRDQTHLVDAARAGADANRTICGYELTGEWRAWGRPGFWRGAFEGAASRCGKCEQHLEFGYGVTLA